MTVPTSRCRPHLRARRALLFLLAGLLLGAPASAEELSARQLRNLVDEAKSALVQGRNDEARALTRNVLAQQRMPRETRVEALLTACAASFNQGFHAAAFAYCDQAEAVGGPSWRVDGLRGFAHLTLGEPERALESFRAGIRQKRDSPALRRGLRDALRAAHRADNPPELVGTAFAQQPSGRVSR